MKILGLGDNVVDRFLDRKTMYPGGQAMNVAVFCHNLGIESAYMGFFGTDEKALLNQKILSTLGIDYSRSRVIEGDNAFACVMTVKGERIFLCSNKGGVARGRAWDFSKEDLAYISSFDFVFTDQNSNMEDNLPLLKNLGCRIVFDFSRKYETDYLKRCAPYVLIAFLSVGEESKTEEILAKMNETAAYGVSIVVATRGVNGSMALFDGKIYSQDSFPTKVRDTMGAGDSFESGFLSSLMFDGFISEKSIKKALHFGAENASKTCATEGSYGFGVPFVLTEYEKELMNL